MLTKKEMILMVTPCCALIFWGVFIAYKVSPFCGCMVCSFGSSMLCLINVAYENSKAKAKHKRRKNYE